MGEPIFPLNEFQTALSNQREFKTDDIFDSFEFYTLSSIEDILTNVTAHGKGFRGILDSYGAVEYDIFHQLFIYSMLKIKNNKY